MDQLLTIPHRRAHGLCPVNGIRDLVQWRTGNDWSNEFLFGFAQGGGFAYLRINVARPPRQVYWGNASPRQHRYIAELLKADYTELENRSFKHTWKVAQAAVDAGIPPVLGPLDMFHLPFYPDLYQQRHIPIHYLLLVGYDNENAYVHDTDMQDIQAVPLAELEGACAVNIPGLGKRNRLVTLNIPEQISPVAELIKRAILDECRMMLKPPISMFGIPAMEKLSGEIANWPTELGQETAGRCLEQVREYLSSPPDVMGDHLTAGRDNYIAFLEQASCLANLDLNEAIENFRSAMQLIPGIASAIREGKLAEAAAGFAGIAQREGGAFSLLRKSVGDAG